MLNGFIPVLFVVASMLCPSNALCVKPVIVVGSVVSGVTLAGAITSAVLFSHYQGAQYRACDLPEYAVCCKTSGQNSIDISDCVAANSTNPLVCPNAQFAPMCHSSPYDYRPPEFTAAAQQAQFATLISACLLTVTTVLSIGLTALLCIEVINLGPRQTSST